MGDLSLPLKGKLRVPKHLEYGASIKWNGRTGGTIYTNTGHYLKFDMAKEFGGEGRDACPDEIFFSSLASCLLTTFLFYRRDLRFHLYSFNVNVKGEMKLELKRYKVSRVEMEVKILVGIGEEKKASRCFKLAEQTCNITEVVKQIVPIQYKLRIKSRGSGGEELDVKR